MGEGTIGDPPNSTSNSELPTTSSSKVTWCAPVCAFATPVNVAVSVADNVWPICCGVPMKHSGGSCV